MPYGSFLRAVLAIVALWFHPSVVWAQLPICPGPDPAAPVYTACSSTGRYVVAPLLADLSVDHTVRGEGVPIQRELRSLFASTMDAASQGANPVLVAYLGGLPALKFDKLDTATGNLRLDVPEASRRFLDDVTVAGVPWKVDLALPERLEGAYWRTPGSVQLVFWKDARLSVKASIPGGPEVAMEVECLAVSTDGIRIVSAGIDKPDVWIRFEACP